MRFFCLIVHRVGLDRGCFVRTAVARAGPQLVKPGRTRLTIVKTPIRSLEPPWTESDCMALALVACNRCFGLGVRPDGSGERMAVCNCVLRAIFRTCYGKWRDIARDQGVTRLGPSAMSRLGPRKVGRRSWTRPREEYRADFELIAHRTLDTRHYAVFRLHFLAGLDWKACCTQLRMDRGNFFHSVYRIEQQLGRAYRVSMPYALFPVYDYFSIAA